MKTIGNRMRGPLMAALCTVVWSSLTHAALAQGDALIDFTAPPTAAYEQQSGGEQPTTLGLLRNDNHVSELRVGELSRAAVAAAIRDVATTVRLPNGETLKFVGLAVSETDGIVRLKGSADEGTAELSVLVDGEDVLGYVESEGVMWRLTPLGGGATAVYRQAPRKRLPHPPARERPQAGPATETVPMRHERAEAVDNRVDVLVVYTEQAALKAGINLRTHALGEIDTTNKVFKNSDVPVRLRLVGVHETTAPDHENLGTSLDEITLTKGECWGDWCDPHGRMDEVHEIRDDLGADLVALITAPGRAGLDGIAWSPNFQSWGGATQGYYGFSVTGVHATGRETLVFAHEIVHNFGGGHDPTTSASQNTPPPYEYGQGFVWDEGEWATLMAYSPHHYAWIPYLSSSSPDVQYEGRPTGKRQQDNRRVVLETTRIVANFRQSKNSGRGTHLLPYFLARSTLGRQGFVRIVNRSDRSGTVTVTAIDDEGRNAGTETLDLDAGGALHFNSDDLELGNRDKGLSGVGPGTRDWRLLVASDLDIQPLAYVRTDDGFVTRMDAVEEKLEGSGYRYIVHFINPGRNRNQRSYLRLINPGSAAADVTIRAYDDRGNQRGPVSLSLPAGHARHVPASDLESGRGLSGRLGTGAGKWRLAVSATRPVHVMSLLDTPTGHITNLSGIPGITGTVTTTPPPIKPDLVVQSPSVSNASPNAGQSFTLRATVSNQGTARSATTLRYYRSTDATISTGDTRVGTDGRTLGWSGSVPPSHRTGGLESGAEPSSHSQAWILRAGLGLAVRRLNAVRPAAGLGAWGHVGRAG